MTGRIHRFARAWTALVLAGMLVGVVAPLRAGASPASRAVAVRCPWVGSSAAISTRVTELMARMTEAEKLQMVHGLDSNTDASSSGPVYAGETAPIPSLCVPALHLEDGPAGVGDGMTGVTQFPAPVALAATFDTQAARAYGAAIGSEQRGKGANVELGPTVNIVRDPRWGRAFETLGEDPYLAGQIAAAEIQGIQSQGVIAMVKHLGVYNEETLRDTPFDNAEVSERAMQEIYLPAFGAAVRRGHAGAVMCSYNEVNGTPACEDPYLLTQVLRGEFGFAGFVASDWFATKSSAESVAAGLDLQMPDSCYYGQALSQDLSDGAVSGSELDAMVRRILTSMFEEGLFDRPEMGSPKAVVTSPSHLALARSVAEEGTVLLKNTGGILPLDVRRVRSIAVIGADGGTAALTAGGGSAAVVAPFVVTPYEGIARRAGRGVTVTYNDGSNPQAAAAAARAAQVAIVFAGLPEAEGEDLATIELPASEDQLIETVARANPHTVVVLNTGSAVTMPWLSSVPAVLEAWYPGEEDGDAIAAVLFGDVDPSGKLPVTFPEDLAQVPAHTPLQWPGVGAISYSEGIDVGYRYYDATGEKPLFPFGYGLSYTTFRFSGARLLSGPAPDGRVRVEVRLTNTGTRAGADVVQLYVHEPPSSSEPPEQLRGFARVSLEPRQTATVRFGLDASDLAFWDPSSRRFVVAPGTYELRFGDSSRDLPLVLSLRVRSELVLPASVPPAPAAPSARSQALSAAADAGCPKDLLAPVVNGGLTVPSDAYSITGEPSPLP